MNDLFSLVRKLSFEINKCIRCAVRYGYEGVNQKGKRNEKVPLSMWSTLKPDMSDVVAKLNADYFNKIQVPDFFKDQSV